MSYVLILGGARSGKSALAQQLAVDYGSAVTVIATAQARDEEMADRIRRHRDTRPEDWRTIEAPLDLLAAVTSAPWSHYLLIDCLTLWVSNLLEHGAAHAGICAAADAVVAELAPRSGVVVTNEVGLGIVPANDLARAFRDALGSVNAIFAANARQAVLMVAGHAVALKPADLLLRPD